MTKREGEGDNEPRCVKCGQPLVTWEQHHVADDCQQWRDADAQIREITERNVRDFRYPSSQSDSDKPKVGPLDMDRINTIGVGIARCSWQAGKVYWWAWTPDGIFTGWADSEEEAKRMGAEAQQAIGTIPKGQG